MANEQTCIAALHQAAQRLGESPTKAQYEDLDITPAASTILRHCGGWNAAKARAGLETNPSKGSRIQPKPADVVLPNDTRWDELSQDQRWHYRHSDRNRARTLARRRRLRRWLHTYKLESDGCTRCGTSEPACLDFHHPDGAEKTMAVNEMVLYGYAREAIRAEIDACELLCANCHARVHQSQLVGMASLDVSDDDRVTRTALPDADETPLTTAERLRVWTSGYKADRGCRHCSVSDPRCLQFHHVGDDKTAAVSQMISDSYPVADVMTEIEKCVVLCANCHRMEHYEPPADPNDGSTD